MRAAYFPYRLHFIEPGGTSRGVLYDKDTYFLKVWDERNPEVFGLGECALFKGLSKEDDDRYEAKLAELCANVGRGEGTDLSGHSSILFGFESAINDYVNGGRRVYFPGAFAEGKSSVVINGLVWMGSKEEMLRRIDAKVASGFHTIKLKIGAIDFESEIEMIKYVRERYSRNELEIRVDANGGFNADNVMQRLERLSKYNLHSIEQPIRQGQWEEMAKICKNSPLHIALDEELIGITDPLEMFNLLNTIRPHYIVLKPSLMGGFSGSTEWLKMASQFNIGAWITSALESNVGLCALAQWVANLEPRIAQGLGTGPLYDNNIACPLVQKGECLSYDKTQPWHLPEFLL